MINPHRTIRFNALMINPHRTIRFNALMINPHRTIRFNALMINPHRTIRFNALMINPHRTIRFARVGPSCVKRSECYETIRRSFRCLIRYIRPACLYWLSVQRLVYMHYSSVYSVILRPL